MRSTDVVFIVGLVCTVYAVQRCLETVPFLRFYKIRECYKSTLPVIARKSLGNVSECMKFARERRGLAFNFIPSEAANLTRDFIVNCQVLGCPEVGSNSSTLVQDPLYDYYTAYGNLSKTENATCLKSLGLYDLILTKKNYTQATVNCLSLGADLASPLTEVRTTALSSLTKSIKGWYKAAYVGLDDIRNEGRFETAMGFLLDCTDFRAWFPGHPRRKHKNEDCVILDEDKVWRAINCRNKLPFICEFFPEAPVNLTNTIKNVNCTNIKGKKNKKTCLAQKKFYKIFKKSSRMDKCALLNALD